MSVISISLNNLIFCIDYFHIPILVDQVLAHFLHIDDISNYRLCKTIINVVGIDSYITKTAYLRLTHSNSFPHVYRQVSIVKVVKMNEEAVDTTMSLHFDDLPNTYMHLRVTFVGVISGKHTIIIIDVKIKVNKKSKKK